ncbi:MULTISPECIES: acetyl-CoA acetyltransferase PhaA [Microcystis]|jgi:acetyl-CoA C-acetyltransferase|uniref:acetyl-CoA C-acetyltransferase n=1 Tax=Microcystis flos-aquae Mf_QC_C_20070823_S10D TaxID=2486236 RepID=A0A552KJV5_9CHRO|nr:MULTISPECIES: acetyl-CoA acetyltransferase PhaA [Microcystis]MCA2816940.1 thiolase family protein [Microcystis sp. M085S1]MCA2855726.1 thiolase family protein [Microcystis sp. M065S1]TRT81541.1 MAG: thiolase family protein [Microcystis flos-aquae Ma_QC_C_20070823_S18]TRT98193.1 MAG: thiolase family protein [Microcystis flos-aquae Ma_QC_C_20070823_S18D]TRV08249.1 MAG: thiolase family protein [Microcystis flos-aquae Mf_QC_C_20070823_S10D]TRV24078.1 MAG: thiolase family protein [Microcystis f
MQEVYIVAAVRTPIGRFGGGLMGLSPADLGATVMKSALEIANLPPEALDLYIFGNVLGSGHGQLIPRQAAIKAGIPVSVDGYRVDMVCSSGMIAVSNAATSIRAGEADLVLAGGIESMSQTGFFLSHRARWGYKFLMGAPEQLTDLLLHDGLTDATTTEGMGSQVDRLCLDRGVSRQALDEIAALSHQRAATATEKGWFNGEIVPIELKSKKGSTIIAQDEGIRSDSTPEGLGKLRPAFNPSGVLTAGNSSQISDGAAAILLASQKAVDQYGLKPIAKILGGAVGAGKTDRFPEFPVLAVKKLLSSLDKTIEDFDLVENNEAFALNNLLFEMDLGLAREKQNVHGGAIALGHPIGASGARILVTLINALKVQDKTLGMGAICHGTGGGTAIAIERV